MTLFKAVEATTQVAFECTTRQLSQYGAIAGKLETMQLTCNEQIQNYQNLIKAMDTGQFDKLGSDQVRNLILSWRNDLLSNLEALHIDATDA